MTMEKFGVVEGEEEEPKPTTVEDLLELQTKASKKKRLKPSAPGASGIGPSIYPGNSDPRGIKFQE